MHTRRVLIIGSGFAGLAAAASLGQKGYEVTVLEKNDQAGGRARRWETQGYTFDMGPSWYWMPDVFENFFHRFGKSVSDYYTLKRLDPGYRVYFGQDDYLDVPAQREALDQLFESIEPGSSQGLKQFLDQAAYKYEVGMRDYVFRPSHSIWEFFDYRLIRESFRIQMFNSMSKHVRKYFSHPKLIELLEFPVLFLGAKPQNTPALYSMMNHADLTLGTWFPDGGMNMIVQGMVKVAEEQGVTFKYDTEVTRVVVENGKATRVETTQGDFEADLIVAGADYQHVDQHLLDPQWRQYSANYWDKRVMSPSSLLFYLGVNKPLNDQLKHHNLFFDEDFNQHAVEIYDQPQWPSKPLFYVSVTTKTDPSGAPEGCENVFVLVPLAPGLEDSEAKREQYYELVMDRLEKLTGQEIRSHVEVKRSYAMTDFEKDYHSFKGNAYGLANTLLQTAFFKPKLKSRKVSNLYYTGQLTTPGPGVPPSLISGQVVATEVSKDFPLSESTVRVG